MRAALSSVEGVDAVTGPQWNPDRSAVLIAVRLAADLEDPAPLVAATAEVQRDHPELEIRQAGDLTIDDAINTACRRGPRGRRGLQPARSRWC